jgi:hypothetical protein
MNDLFRQKLILLIVLLSLFIKPVSGQNDTIVALSDSINHYNASSAFNACLFRNLPFTDPTDIYQLNPAIYRSDNQGGNLINGIYSSGDYTWFDGVPLDFIDEMPLRLIGEARFDNFDEYLKSGNSLTGFARLEPIHQSDSLTFLVETSSRLIYRQFNDADLQVLISGPLIKQASGNRKGTMLNYTLAGRLFSSADSDPSYVLRNQAAPDYLEYLEDEPLRPATNGGTYENAWFTEEADAVSSYFNSNAAKKGFSIYGNIKADFQNGMFLKFGTYTVDKKEAVPIYENYMFNQNNNPDRSTSYSNNYLLFGQQIDSKGPARLTYQVQGQYSLLKSTTEDPVHGSDLFRPGYVGKFDTYKSPTFEIGTDTVNGIFYDQAMILNSWDYDTLVEFTPGNVNPGLSAYTSSYYSIYNGEPEGNYENSDQIHLGGGLLNGQMPRKVYGLWHNTGTAYSSYSVNDDRRVNITASGMLELGKHQINLGFQFRRDSYSSYQANPVGLWGLMRSLTNFHISELDISHPFVHEGDLMDTIYYYRKYDALSQSSFDRNLREALGLDPEGLDFIDIDSYDYANNTINYYDKEGIKHTLECGKELFSLDMFSVDELLNDGIASYVSYSGYDHLGNRNRDKVAFEDFFNAKNEEGEYVRPVGAYTPMNYSVYAGYRTDLRGWSFDAGFRLEAFDAHQQVLKDPLQVEISTSAFTKNQIYFNFLPQVSIEKSFKNWLLLTLRYNSAVSAPNPEITFSNPAAYYFINNASGWVPNGSLKPERTDKLRAGLSVMPIRKLVLTAEGFMDYYSNRIYLIRRVGAYPKDYTSFYNEEDPFSQYGLDLAINGISGKTSGFNYGLSYHLLFNEDNFSGPLYDFLLPKNLVKGYLQFNTGSGKDYMGPSGSVSYSIFSDLGIGLFSQFHSGVHYWSIRNPDGSNVPIYNSEETMPAQAFLDLKIEKGFHFNNDRFRLILYCTIQNLFNTEVVYRVYRFTGEPDDNGYLEAPETQQQISQALSEASYRFLYASYINDPNHYGLPRRTTLGISFSF